MCWLRKQLPSDEGYGWDPSEVEAEKPCLGVPRRSVDPSSSFRRSVGGSGGSPGNAKVWTLGRGHWHHRSLGVFRSLRLLQAGRLWRVSWWETGKSCWMIGVFWSWFLGITEVSIQKSSWVEAWTSCHAGCLDVPFLCLWIPLGWGKNGKMLVGHASFGIGYPLHW